MTEQEARMNHDQTVTPSTTSPDTTLSPVEAAILRLLDDRAGEDARDV